MQRSTLSGSKNCWLRAWWLLAPLFMVACGSGGAGDHLASDPGASQQRGTSLPPVTGAARNFAYALSNDAANRGVSAYAMNPTTGALNAVGAPAAAGDNPVAAAATPGGRFLYVANSFSNDVSAYRITPATGALNPLGRIAAGSNPQF